MFFEMHVSNTMKCSMNVEITLQNDTDCYKKLFDTLQTTFRFPFGELRECFIHSVR